jgi:hypothetical protein
MQRTAQSMMGKSDGQVFEALGHPKHVVRAEDLKGHSMDFPWSGLNFQPIPTRPISSKVYYYSDGWLAAYVYLDRRGTVEHVAIAGT